MANDRTLTAEKRETVEPVKPFPEIQLLTSVRGAAMIMVFIYHIFTPHLRGGFLGVDIFFTISGYLITLLLVREAAIIGRVRFVAFAKRRFARLFPSVAFLVIVTLAMSLLITEDFRVDIRRQAAAALTWTTNLYEIVSGGSYENMLLPHLFVHTWTLGVEMQFYFAWGGVIAVTTLLASLKTKFKTFFRRVLPLVIAAASVGITWYNLATFAAGVDDPSRAYYSPLSHSLPLLVGALAGLLCGADMPSVLEKLAHMKKFRPYAYIILGAFAVTIAVLAVKLTYLSSATYYIGIPLTSILTALAIVLIRMVQLTRKLREVRILRWVGERSYALYLFHWPMYIITSRLALAAAEYNSFFNHITLMRWAAVSATLLLGSAAYKYVEQRFRKTGDRKKPKRKFTLRVAATELLYVVVPVSLVALSYGALINPPLKSSAVRDYERAALALDVSLLSQLNNDFLAMSGSPLSDGVQLTGIPTASRGNTDIPLPPSLARFAGLVTVVGDSVTLGSSNAIMRAVPNATVDAAVSRNMNAGVTILGELQDAGQLGEFVVIALASNGGATVSRASENIIEMLEPGHRVIFVTGHGKDFMAEGNEYLRTLPDKYDFVTIADWDMIIADKEFLLSSDGVHTANSEAKRLYAECIAQAINTARERGISP